MTTVSIVIPVYNAAKYLENSIKSVLRQKYPNWELILVDDGSTDASGTICDIIAKSDCRIKAIHTENQGVTAARSNGVMMSSGDWICFLDADDILLENSITTMISKSAGSDIVIGNKQVISKNEIKKENINLMDKQITALDFLSDLITNRISQYITGRIFRKALFDNGTINIPKNIIMAEDFIMNIQLGNKAKYVTVIQDYVYGYYVYDSSVSHTFTATLEYESMFCSHIEEAIKQGEYFNQLKKELIFQKVCSLKIAFLAQKGRVKLDDMFLNDTIKAGRSIPLTKGWRLFLRLVTMRHLGYLLLRQVDRL